VKDERRANLHQRLRRSPSASTVPGTLPVLFFGDLFAAEVASVGLNPSDHEYLTKGGAPLTGAAQRFANLASLEAADRAQLTETQCDEAIDWMRAYYDEGKPVYGSWFNSLSRVVEGFGASFPGRSAAHLDLVQESTSPVWSELPAGEKDSLLREDLPFLEWEIRAYPITAVICTGKTVSVHLRSCFGVEIEEEGTLARIKWWVGRADVDGREVDFAGWNYPLARATGLGAVGERELGELLAAKLEGRDAASPAGSASLSSRDASSEPAAAELAAKPVGAPTVARRGSRLRGLTHPVWDGVSLPTLRYWLRWWLDETKSAGRVENGWGREEQVERISAEIAARETAGSTRSSVEAAPSQDRLLDERAAANPTDLAMGNDEGQASARHRLYRESASREDLLETVERRQEAVRDYLEWAKANDNEQWTFRMSARPDIKRAAEATERYPDDWWGVVVYSCFDSATGAAAVASHLSRPLPPSEAAAVLESIGFPRGSVGGHRIQPGVQGARRALVAACADHELFFELLHRDDDFDTRYLSLRSAKLPQWGRTTSFDLFLRAGAIGIGGGRYKPEYAYLGGSTGPKSGFARVFGETLATDAQVARAESLLWHWTETWDAVAAKVGVQWDKPPLEPCDQENFLCIYQERR
jgi:hypothetical protein